MKQTEEGNLNFKKWLLNQTWNEVYEAKSSLEKAKAYQNLMSGAMDACYPVVTVKRKSSEDPWITDKIRKNLGRGKRYSDGKVDLLRGRKLKN